MVSVCLPSDALLQHLPSYLGFFYLGCGVSLHGCSSKAQLLLLTLDEGYLLTAAVPDLQRGIAPLGKTARPFRYDLYQIPYDYTVEVRNRFKGLDLTVRVPDELWTGDRDQDHPPGKEMQKSKMVVWGSLTNSCEKKRSEKQRRGEKI